MSKVKRSAVFDYAELPQEVAVRSRERAARISDMMVKTAETMGSIGRELLTAQDELGHGKFLRWIASELRISSSAAYRFMDVAKSFGDKFPTVGTLPVTVVEKLAEQSTPAHVRQSVIDRISAGERPSPKAILKQVKEAKAEARRKSDEEKEIARRTALSFEERAREDKREKRTIRNKALYDKQRAEEIRADNEKRCRNLQTAREAAQVLIDKLGQDAAARFFRSYRFVAADVFNQGADAISIMRAENVPVTTLKRRDLEGWYPEINPEDKLIYKEMTDKIRLSGTYEPLVVLRQVDNPTRSYEIIEGADRFRALRILKWDMISVRIVPPVE